MNKVPYYYYYFVMITYSLYFWYVLVSTCCAEKIYRTTSVGVTHHDHKIKIYRENYAIQNIIDRGPRMAKWALRGPPRWPHSQAHGRSAHHLLLSRLASSTVRFEPNIL
jgi:hypothetical protein